VTAILEACAYVASGADAPPPSSWASFRWSSLRRRCGDSSGHGHRGLRRHARVTSFGLFLTPLFFTFIAFGRTVQGARRTTSPATAQIAVMLLVVILTTRSASAAPAPSWWSQFDDPILEALRRMRSARITTFTSP